MNHIASTCTVYGQRRAFAAFLTACSMLAACDKNPAPDSTNGAPDASSLGSDTSSFTSDSSSTTTDAGECTFGKFNFYAGIYDETGQCYEYPVYFEACETAERAGLTPDERICEEVEGFALSPDGDCWMFPNLCFPAGWTDVTFDESTDGCPREQRQCTVEHADASIDAVDAAISDHSLDSGGALTPSDGSTEDSSISNSDAAVVVGIDASRPSCEFGEFEFAARHYKTDGNCYAEVSYFDACETADRADLSADERVCEELEGLALSPDGDCWMFPNLCFPAGWVDVTFEQEADGCPSPDSPLCDVQP